MTEFEQLIKLIQTLKLESIFGPVLTLIMLFWVSKKYLFAGAGAFAKEAFTAWICDQKERLKVEIEIEQKLAELVKKIELIAEGLWENRRLMDDRIQTFEHTVQRNLVVSETILTIISKDKEKQA